MEKTLIDNARTHQEVLANYYPKYRARKSVGDDHTEYLKHSGALTDLVSLTHHDSGLSAIAAELLREVEAQDMAVFKLHFPIDSGTTECIEAQASTQIFIKNDLCSHGAICHF